MQDYIYSVIGFIAIAVQLIINFKVMFVSGTNSERRADRINTGVTVPPVKFE